MMNEQFEMVAKTFMGLEEVLAEELRLLGGINVEPGNRMVSFEGDLGMLYKANMCCRTALRVLKPFYKFTASDPDTLYDMVKEYDWGALLSPDKTFAIDTTVYSDEFTHSRYVTYRVKDAIVDWFKDRLGDGKRPGVRLQDADVMINVHISGSRVTLSLDSSGESLHKRGYRVAQTDAPINEVLAAGIILRSGWRGDTAFVDPMCGSGTFLIEAALIAANIMPGVYRKHFAFESWPDFDRDLFESIYNDDSGEREVTHPIVGADVLPKAVAIAEANIKSAGVGKYITLECRNFSKWEEAPAPEGVIVTNPPYGERIVVEDMEGLYRMIGSQLKHVFRGWHAWIIGYSDDYFGKIGLAPSVKVPMMNGSLPCELREYVIFDGDYRSFRRAGGKIKDDSADGEEMLPRKKKYKREDDRRWRDNARRKGFGGRDGDDDRSDRRRDFRKGRDFKRGRYGDENERNRSPRPRRELPPLPQDREERLRRRHENSPFRLEGSPLKPSIPASAGVRPLQRRGWKKKD